MLLTLFNRRILANMAAKLCMRTIESILTAKHRGSYMITIHCLKKFSTGCTQRSIQRCLLQPTHYSHPQLMNEDDVTPGLTKNDYKIRRNSLMEMICNEKINNSDQKDAKGHALIILSAPIRYMSQDIPYPFHQNTNFSYLTGFQESDSCLVMEAKPGSINGSHTSTLFVQKRDPIKELWNGARAGIDGALEHTGVDATESIENLKDTLKNYLSEHYTIWYDFKEMTNLPLHLSHIRGFLQEAVKQQMTIRQVLDPIHEMRNVKCTKECRLMAKSCDIISEAFIDAMSICRSGMNEAEIGAKMEFVAKKEGAQMLAFPPVVAGGNRANTLHYIVNNQTLFDGELVLVDAGAHYHGYVSDITRTWPVSGRFTETQRNVYEAVLRVQQFCIGLCKPGNSLDDIYNQMSMALIHELIHLGIIQKQKQSELVKTVTTFCPHHVGHWLGMDIHDTSGINRSMKLLPGMVVTIEPGLYIREDNLEVDSMFRGMGIRIEDDVLITAHEPIVLSSNCPKSVEEIEKIMSSS